MTTEATTDVTRQQLEQYQLELYGASDDLIELEGQFAEEFNVYPEEDGVLVAVSDGTVLRVTQRKGVWRFTPAATGRAQLHIAPAPENDDENYSDRVTLSSGEPFAWVVCGHEMRTPPK